MEIALSKFCGDNDIITPIFPAEDERTRKNLGFKGKQNYRKHLKEWNLKDVGKYFIDRVEPKKFWNHMPASEIKEKTNNEVWDSYFKFSVVRNPFEVVVSTYFMQKYIDNISTNFHDWLKGNSRIIRLNYGIYSIDGKVAVDKLIQYERLEEDLREVGREIKIDEDIFLTMKGIKAKGSYRKKEATAKQLFNGFDEGIELINILAKEEIEMFNYGISD